MRCLAVVFVAGGCGGFNGLVAQSRVATDFIVLHSGDTLYGDVTHTHTRGAGLAFHKKIRIRDISGKKRKINRKKIAAFKNDHALYESFYLKESTQVFPLKTTFWIVQRKGTLHFLKVIQKGNLSHYQLEWIEQGTAHVQAMDLLLKKDDAYFIRATQGIFGIKTKVLTAYFSECTAVQKALQEKQFSSVFDLVTYYNIHCSPY